MKMNKFNFFKNVLCFLIAMFLISCNSIQQPSEVVGKIDYSNINIVESEKKIIREIQKEDSLKALWRSVLLKDSQIISESLDIVIEDLKKAIADKDTFNAQRIAKSLKNVDSFLNLNSENLTTDLLKYAEYSDKNIPGFNTDKDFLPKTISDCINATVTIWVDKGIKVENGAGVMDIVIGSGFFIDKRGYLITNYHVIQDLVDPTYEGYARLYIKKTSDTETKIPAVVVGYDSIIDLALLKVEIEPEFVLELGSSSDLSVGDKISAIGTPIGLEGTITSGIISSANRSLSTIGNYFQIDAAVNSGNSGGPLIDENMKVQAIVFAGMLQFQGLNFAIPVEYLKQELPFLFFGGEINHCWIGAYGKTKRVKNNKVGIETYYVMPGGSAFYTDIKEGCVIKSIDGISVDSLEDFQFKLMNYAPKTIVKLEYISNDGIEEETLLYLEKRPKDPLVQIYNSDFISDSFYPIFGMKLIRSSTIYRNSYTIEKIISGSIADENGFSVGDPITVREVKLDHQYKYLISQIYVKRRKRGFLDIVMGLGSPFDSPNYF